MIRRNYFNIASALTADAVFTLFHSQSANLAQKILRKIRILKILLEFFVHIQVVK